MANAANLEYTPLYQAHLTVQKAEPVYKEVFTPCAVGTRVALIAFFILSLTVFALYHSGHFWTLPQDFMQWIHQINPINAAIGGTTTAVLIGGMSLVIHRARTSKDRLLEQKRGDIEDIDKHLEVVYQQYTTRSGKTYYNSYYLDKSTVQGEGAEKAYLYRIKTVGEHYFVSSEVSFLGAPVYFVGTVVYNALRTVIIPFYILFQYGREKLFGTPVANSMVKGGVSKKLYMEERSFELLDIPKEMLKSIARILQAPFYALAYMFAALYSLVNPMGGRKLAAAIERDWNDEVSLAEGYWSVGICECSGSMELFKFEGGGGPLSLGRNGFYLAGCWQPVGIAEFQDGEFQTAYGLAHAVDPSYKDDIELYWRSDLERFVNDNSERVEQLKSQFDKLDT